MILGALTVRRLGTKRATIMAIIAVLFLVISLSTKAKRETYKEDIKQHPIKHMLAFFIG